MIHTSSEPKLALHDLVQHPIVLARVRLVDLVCLCTKRGKKIQSECTHAGEGKEELFRNVYALYEHMTLATPAMTLRKNGWA